MNHKLDQALKQFTDDVKRIYAETLLSIILYGSAASHEYVEGKSNINCLVLLEGVTPDELRRCADQLSEWHKQGFSTPLFVDPAYVRSSIDVFPIEFLDMKQRYRVLIGRDFLRDLELRLDHLQFQCEQELKGKMLKLRQLYLEASRSEQRLVSLLSKSISSFIVLFRALLYLRGNPVSGSANDIIAGLERLDLRTEAISKVHRLKVTQEPQNDLKVDALFREYLSEIQAATALVDKPRTTQPGLLPLS